MCINFDPLYFVEFQLRLSCSVLLLRASFFVFIAESIDLHICQVIMIVSPDVTSLLEFVSTKRPSTLLYQTPNNYIGLHHWRRVAFVGVQVIHILKCLVPV